MMKHGLNNAKKILINAGAKISFGYGPVRNTGWHIMGTAKMGNNPNKSVVNKFGQCHDIKNVFIVDSSIFVTSGGVNCMSTIQALSLYITNNLKLHFNNLVGKMLSLKEQKIFIKKIIDKMIPNNKLYKMPAASKVINFNIFLIKLEKTRLL